MESVSEHGTPSRYQHEMKVQGHACAECIAANRDYARAWRIRTGRSSTMVVSVALLEQLTRITDPAYARQVLAAEVGHLTREAISEAVKGVRT